MKPHRVRQDTAKSKSISQSAKGPDNHPGKPHRENASLSALLNPARAALAMIAALNAFRFRVNEAGSLGLLIAANIEWNAKSFGGWENFDSHPEFVSGAYGLSRSALDKLSREAEVFRAAHAPLVERLRARDGLVPPAPFPAGSEENATLLVNCNFRFGDIDTGNFEESFHAMQETLKLLGLTLYERAGCQVGYYAMRMANENLEAAFDELWAAAASLREAAIAAEHHRAGESRAAA
jgi:hypothetical protein